MINKDNNILSLFNDDKIKNEVTSKLPVMFEIVNKECTRGNKIGMEVGKYRERVLIAMLIHIYGYFNVNSDLPENIPSKDVILFDEALSVKTFSGDKYGSVKLSWTVDSISVSKFKEEYIPNCGMLLAHINWNNTSPLYYFSKSVQMDVFNLIGREKYSKLPKEGTNSRGIELSKDALFKLINHEETLKLPINWIKRNISVDVYERWVKMWNKPLLS